MTAAAKKIKTAAAVFELPQRLILQYVECELSPKEWCLSECLYEGVLTAEGCKKGVCIKYCVWVYRRGTKPMWSSMSDIASSNVSHGVIVPRSVAWGLREWVGVGHLGCFPRSGLTPITTTRSRSCGTPQSAALSTFHSII
jgi:hypothetical protein